MTLFHVSGAYIYVYPDGNATGIEDVFSKVDRAWKHYAEFGLGADYVNQLIR
jgi:2,4'-dihydroxyacetophenone dioxygenase